MLILAHETYPGRLYQAVYQRSLGSISLTQQLLTSTSYAEGWSQFAERLAAQNLDAVPNGTALYLHNAYMDQIFQLSYCSILVNCYGYSKDQLDKEWGSYMASMYTTVVDAPYSYLDYAFGYINFMETYEKTKEELGDSFDVAEYAEAYLSMGPAYSELLDQRMEQWAQEKTEQQQPIFEHDPSVSAEFAKLDCEFYKTYVSRDIISYLESGSDGSGYGVAAEDINWSWPSFTKESWTAWHDTLRSFKSRLEQIDKFKLTEQKRVGYDTLLRYIDITLEGEQYYGYDPILSYPKFIIDDMFYILTDYPFNNEQDVDNYFKLMEATPGLMQQIYQYELYRAEQGIFDNEALSKEIGTYLNRMVSIKSLPKDMDMLDDNNERISQLEGLSQERIAELQAKNTELVSEVFVPALKELNTNYATIEKSRHKTIRTGQQSDMMEYYRYRVKVASGYGTDEFAEHLFNNMDYFMYGLSNDRYKMTNNRFDFIPLDRNTLEAALLDMTQQNLPKLALPELKSVSHRDIASTYLPGRFILDGEQEQSMFYRPWASNDKAMVWVTWTWHNTNQKIDLLEIARETFPGKAYLYAYVKQGEQISAAQKALMPLSYTESWEVLAQMYATQNNNLYDRWHLSYWANMHCFFAMQRQHTSLIDNYYNGIGDANRMLSRYYGYRDVRGGNGYVYNLMNETAGVMNYYELMEEVKTKLDDKFNEEEFMAYYLSLGPSYPEILRQYVLAHYEID